MVGLLFLQDAIHDQMEVWRTQPDIFLDGLLDRAASTIVFPWVRREDIFSTSCMNALQSRLHISHVSNCCDLIQVIHSQPPETLYTASICSMVPSIQVVRGIRKVKLDDTYGDHCRLQEGQLPAGKNCCNGTGCTGSSAAMVGQATSSPHVQRVPSAVLYSETGEACLHVATLKG